MYIFTFKSVKILFFHTIQRIEAGTNGCHGVFGLTPLTLDKHESRHGIFDQYGVDMFARVALDVFVNVFFQQQFNVVLFPSTLDNESAIDIERTKC